jgi:hypothetical protein
MANLEQAPVRLWSDFDGTAVKHYPMRNARNWGKYPLPLMPGYIEFLRGFVDAGGEIGGIITARASWRKMVTARSLRKLELLEHFAGHPGTTHHLGSDRLKASFMVLKAATAEPAESLIDDKPEKVGVEIARVMSRDDNNAVVTLGVVPGAKQQSRISDFGDVMSETAESMSFTNGSGTVETVQANFGNSTLHVVALSEYSYQGGQEFHQVVLKNKVSNLS